MDGKIFYRSHFFGTYFPVYVNDEEFISDIEGNYL